MMKEKPNSTRIYDEDGYRKRAACVCVRDETETEVLLVTSSSHPDQWIVPGGGLEPEETYEVAALRELTEEAGVQGRIDRFLGMFKNEERKHITAVYVLIVEIELSEWEDSQSIGRQRKWFSFDDAMEQIAWKPVQIDYFEQLRPHTKMMEENPNSTRIYDEDGYRKRAACVCVRDETETEVLLVSSSSHPDQWIVPGGGLEPEETYEVAALRELTEEAGVQGRIDRFLGMFKNEERKQITAVYVLIVEIELSEWEDSQCRKRKWFSFDDAMEQIAWKPVQIDYLEQLRPHKRLSSQTENGTAGS